MNRTIVGFLLGLFLPVITMWVLYEYSYGGGRSFGEFYDAMIRLESFSTMMAVSCLSNLAVCTFCAFTDNLKIARVIMLSTVVWGIVVMVFKFCIQ